MASIDATDAHGGGTATTSSLVGWFRNGGIGWVLGLLPLGLVIWFLSMVAPVAAGETLMVSYPWVPSLGVNLAFAVDGLGLLFALIVSGIGALVFFYGGGYMAGDAQIGRFFLYLLLFMFSMLGVVLADNLITLFVFWELTSITSFLLIGFKHAYVSSRSAALQALLVTGIGGLVLMAGLLLLGMVGGSWQISTLLERGDIVRASPLYTPMLVLVLIGAFTKSAQFPFHFWLPGAMAAPTPVSAYLHSATMVKAGIYLLARFSPVLGGTLTWQVVVTTFGAVTMVLGAYLAVTQVDLKRILAFTTVSGLGTLTMLLGVGTEYAVKAAIVFLVVHALYKATLFMTSGAIDHETGMRDISGLGGLRGTMSLTFAAAALAALSMSGIPPFFGFIGKEAIYEVTVEVHAVLAAVALTAAVFISKTFMMVAAGMVAIKPFFGPPVSTPKKAHEAPVGMWIGPLFMGSLGLLIGLLPEYLAQPLVNQTVGAVLGVEDPHIKLYLFPDHFSLVVLLSAITILAGAVIYYTTYFYAPGIVKRSIDPIRGVVELGPERAYTWLLEGMQAVARWQTSLLQSGYLRRYLLITVITTVVLTGYALLSRVDLGKIQMHLIRDVYIYEWVIVAVILLAALFVARSTRRLQAVVGLGVVGFGVAAIFTLNSAPDLAMTQFAIETLSVILIVLVVYRLPEFTTVSSTSTRARDALVSLAAGALMTVLVLTTTAHDWDEGRLMPSEYYAESSYTLANGRNVVNVILVDFRALDTMGEITVLAIGAIGIYTLIKLRPGGTDKKTHTDEEKQP